MVTSEGEAGVMANLKRKQIQADAMFDQLVENMNNQLRIEHKERFNKNGDSIMAIDKQILTDKYAIYNGDCIEVSAIASGRIHTYERLAVLRAVQLFVVGT